MSSKVRVGVIGTSAFAEGSHIRPLASHPQAEIAALCGRSAARAGELAQRYAIPQVFSDYRELIAAGGLDAVVIVTPDDLHHPMTMAALAAGKHVLCEKALAMNQAQAREMYETAERLGRVHMTNFPFRFHPAFQRMVDLARQGYAGRALLGQMSFLAGFARAPGYQWRADPRHSNGMLADLGAHLFDLGRLLFGEAQAVAAHTAVYFEKPAPAGGPLNQANDTAAVLLEYAASAAPVQVTCDLSTAAWTADLPALIRLALHGADGGLELSLPVYGGTPALCGSNAPGEPLQPLEPPARLWGATDPALPPAERFAALFTHEALGDRLFIDAIDSGTPAAPTFYDGWKAQVVIDAAIEAARTRRWVEIKA